MYINLVLQFLSFLKKKIHLFYHVYDYTSNKKNHIKLMKICEKFNFKNIIKLIQE